jgi:hypothetical protein
MSVGSPPARPTPPDASVFNRILMLLVPDATATGIGIGLVAVFFAAGFLEMLSKHYAEAESYFYLAFGMMAFLITMKYLTPCCLNHACMRCQPSSASSLR